MSHKTRIIGIIFGMWSNRITFVSILTVEHEGIYSRTEAICAAL